MPHGGFLQIDTCGSSCTPLVTAYTGTAVNALTALGTGPVAVFCGTTNTWITGQQIVLPRTARLAISSVEGGIAPEGPGDGQLQPALGPGRRVIPSPLR